MNNLISVVTLTHNKVECTRKCLRTLLASTFSPWELVVVDNGSSDGTTDWLDEFKAETDSAGVVLKVIQNRQNVGCSTARNQGLAASDGQFVVFVDNDVALRSQSWLGALRSKLTADPALAIAGPKLVYPFHPHDIQCAGVGISSSGRVQFMGRGESNSDPRFNKEGPVQCLISACFMTRKSVIQQVGGFSEEFNPVEYEDFDLCYRVRETGSTVTYVPAVEMYHFESVTTTGTPTLPNTYLIIKHGMLFKRKWRHMFENEDGPLDRDTKWRTIEAHGLDQATELPLINT